MQTGNLLLLIAKQAPGTGSRARYGAGSGSDPRGGLSSPATSPGGPVSPPSPRVAPAPGSVPGAACHAGHCSTEAGLTMNYHQSRVGAGGAVPGRRIQPLAP